MRTRDLLTILSLIFLPIVQSLHFDLQSGHTKCIAEDIKANAMSVGKYSIVNPNEGHPLPDTHKITVKVTSTYGNTYHYGDHVDSGQFAFAAAEAGDYMTCFYAPDFKHGETITIDFEWRTGVAAKDWSNVAKKGQVDIMDDKDDIHEKFITPQRYSHDKVMELELKKLEDTVKNIHDEMFYLREREEEMHMLNRATNSRMAWLSFLSLFICLSVAGWQLWHLKTFFERKKLL